VKDHRSCDHCNAPKWKSADQSCALGCCGCRRRWDCWHHRWHQCKRYFMVTDGQCTHAWALLTGCKEQYTISIILFVDKAHCTLACLVVMVCCLFMLTSAWTIQARSRTTLNVWPILILWSWHRYSTIFPCWRKVGATGVSHHWWQSRRCKTTRHQ